MVEELKMLSWGQYEQMGGTLNSPGQSVLLTSIEDDTVSLIISCPNCGIQFMVPDVIGPNSTVSFKRLSMNYVTGSGPIQHNCGIVFKILENKITAHKKAEL